MTPGHLAHHAPAPGGAAGTLLAAAALVHATRITIAVPPRRQGAPEVHLWSQQALLAGHRLGLADHDAAASIAVDLFSAAADSSSPSWRPGVAMTWKIGRSGTPSHIAAPLQVLQLPGPDGSYCLDIGLHTGADAAVPHPDLAVWVSWDDRANCRLLAAYPSLTALNAGDLPAIAGLLAPSGSAGEDLRELSATATAAIARFGGLPLGARIVGGPYLLPDPTNPAAGAGAGFVIQAPGIPALEAWLVCQGQCAAPSGFELLSPAMTHTPKTKEDGTP